MKIYFRDVGGRWNCLKIMFSSGLRY